MTEKSAHIKLHVGIYFMCLYSPDVLTAVDVWFAAEVKLEYWNLT